MPESMGSGAVFLDYDNDGWLDLYLVDSGSVAEREVATPARSALYRNEADGTFTDVTGESGITNPAYGMGACAADFDNDGWIDLYLANYGPNFLYRNNGDGTFTDVTREQGVGSSLWSTGCAFGDIDNDADLDLYVANFVDFSVDNNQVCQNRLKVRDYCHPNVYDGLPDVLYRNDSGRSFTDVTREAGVWSPAGKGLGVVFGDYNGDGWADIYVANDSVPNFLYENQRDGTFVDVGLLAGVTVNGAGEPEAGMGTDSGDLDNDGLLDIFVTNLDMETNSLYRNLGEGLFADVTFASGHGAPSLGFVGWGAAFFDYDNDGDQDLMVANGHVMMHPVAPIEYPQRNFLFRNGGSGAFEEVGLQSGPALAEKKVSRGLAVGDIDNDGDLDVLISNNGQSADLLLNEGGNRKSSVLTRLIGTKSNRDGVGARLQATIGSTTQLREIKAGSSYLGQNDLRAHFGLGDASRIDRLEVRWPSGIVDVMEGVAANQILTIAEGRGLERQEPYREWREAAPRPAEPPSRPAQGIRLTDVAAEAGVTVVNVCGRETKDYILETNGNGAAFFDFDNDDDMDLLIVNGSTLESMKEGGDPVVTLYRNQGGGEFVDVTAGAGLGKRGWGMGVCVADYDNDGWRDYYVTAYGPNFLFRNNGNGTFSEIAGAAGVADSRWGTNCAFGDYDRDGHVDLYVANYLAFDEKTVPKRGASSQCRFKEIDVMCGPLGLPGEADVLYRNNSDGTFSDVTAGAGIIDPGYYGFGVVFSDLDNDGWPDIYVGNDSTPNFLFRNNRDGTFSEEALFAGVALNDAGLEQAGMGVDIADYDNDGFFDIFVTNFSHDTNTLYRNGKDGLFRDETHAASLGVSSLSFLGWGTGFVDLDNDGLLDIFIANGHVYPEIDESGLGSTYLQPNQVYRNLGDGRFREITAELSPSAGAKRSSRGAAFGDYDNDGDMDALVVNLNDRPHLLRNEGGNGNHWLTLQLVGTASNRDAIGARVTAMVGGRRQMAEVQSGGSYLSHNDSRVHFGLGGHRRVARLEIRWPSGVVEEFDNVAGDQFLIVKEGLGAVAQRPSGDGTWEAPLPPARSRRAR